MAAGNVLTGGYGISGGLAGTGGLVLRMGYGVGDVVVPPTTSRPFYRPGSVNVAGNQRGRVDVAGNQRGSAPAVADVRPLSADDQVM